MTQLGVTTFVRHLPLTPPPVSLLNTALIEEEPNERWVNGFNYVPDASGIGEAFILCDNDPVNGFEKSVIAATPPVTGTPYGIVAQDTCSTFSYRYRDYQARATRQLLAIESYVIANEMWEGNLGINPKLADPSCVIASGPTTPTGLLLAVATIEEAFFSYSKGQRPMIHMRPSILTAIEAFAPSGFFRREGTIYYTPMDSIIVADRGYTGTGPNGEPVATNDEWIYATPMVQIRHSPINVFPGTMSEATLRKENQVTFFAERAVQATWDYNTPTIALNIKQYE